MDMYKEKWTGLQAHILRFLSIKAGHSFNMREIARALKVSPTAVSNSLPALEKEGLIKLVKSKKMNLSSVEFNRDSQEAVEFKRALNLRIVYESGLARFLEDNFPGSTIILFGSYSRGDDVWTNEDEGHKSDVDIAVIGSKERQIKLTEFDKKLERTVFINFYQSLKSIHKDLRDNILNGIVLAGSVNL